MSLRFLTMCWVLAAALALAGGAAAQGTAPDVAWEQMPLVPLPAENRAYDVLFLPRGGAGGYDLVWVHGDGPLVYNPGTTRGYYGGEWDNLCTRGCGPDAGIVTSEGSVLIGAFAGPTDVDRLPAGGRWEYDVAGDGYGTTALLQATLPALRGPGGHGAVFAGTRAALRSDDDGRPGSWAALGETGGEVVAFGEVPPSAALPDGRLLAGMYNGVSYSDDGGRTWTPGAGAYGFARYIAHSFAVVPEPGHPYGGPVLAGVDDLAWGRDSTATVYRSDDGGATWARVHRFRPSALGLANANEVRLLAGPDGAVWAGVTYALGGQSRYRPGAIARSEDGGATWAPVQEGYGGHGVERVVLGPDGRVYAATVVGVWRTADPVYAVASEPGAPTPPAVGVGLTVAPNPTGGAVTVALRLASPERVRVAVVDGLGREVAVAYAGTVADGQRLTVEMAGLAPGVYRVVAVAASGATASAPLTVVR